MTNETYMVCEISFGEISLGYARRFTEEEKKGYVKEFRESGFVGVGNRIYLESLTWDDARDFLGCKTRNVDGGFPCSNGQVYIITQEEWDSLVALDEKAKSKSKQDEIIERIEDYEKIIKNCEERKKAGNLYSTREEANAARKRYNDLHNEGGEGYIPVFYTVDDYENAKKVLEELRSLLEK